MDSSSRLASTQNGIELYATNLCSRGLEPSIGVLRKTGFELVGDGSEPGVIRFEHVGVVLS